jgi:diguanylate cyclase (GGDEF)-like protein
MTSAAPLPIGHKPTAVAKSSSRLLVVGEPPTTTRTLEIFSKDHEVFVAGSGVKTVEICRSILPDLILLDAVLQDMDGLEICRRLKADPDTRDIPVILLTDKGNPAGETQALKAGVADFVTKPVNPAVVRARVNTHLTLKSQSDLIASLAFVDGLTAVSNRRRFDEGLEAEWRRCRRLITPLALLMIDIDNFKKYNDVYGHLAGDACLQKVAAILEGQIGRSHDLLARFGGNKFTCLLPDIYFDGAQQKAEAMVKAVRGMKIPHAASETAPVVTISMGVVVTIPGPDRQPGEMVSNAEAQLREAKQQGRNRVCGLELAGYFSNSLK